MAYDAAYHPARHIEDASGVSQCCFLHSTGDSTYQNEPISHQQLLSPGEEVPELATDDYLHNGTHSTGSLYTFGDRAFGIAGKMFDGGKRIFLQQRQCVQMGEGPTLLRFLCFLGGLGMFVSSVLSMINIFAFLTGPSTYVLQIYQGFFGIITMIVEAKDWDCLDQFKPWMVEWFRFLTVPAGKGAFYIFVGSLGVSLWVRNLLSFTVGLYMGAMGLICIAIHAGASRKRMSTLDSRIQQQQNDDDLYDIDDDIQDAYEITNHPRQNNRLDLPADGRDDYYLRHDYEDEDTCNRTIIRGRDNTTTTTTDVSGASLPIRRSMMDNNNNKNRMSMQNNHPSKGIC